MVAGCLVAGEARAAAKLGELTTSAGTLDEPLAQGKPELVYGGDDSFPPYEFLDPKTGEPAGLNVALIRAVARRAGLTVRVELMPWARVRTGLRSGAIDVASMYRSAQRAQEVDFAIPHELTYHELFVRRGGPVLRSLHDLAGRRVVVQGGTFSSDALRELGHGAGLVEVASEPEALAALARGEGEVAVVTQTVGRPFRERKELGGAVVPTGPPVLFSEYGFVTRKGRRALVERLNEGVAVTRSSGEYDHLYETWINPDCSAHRARTIAWALGAALAAVLLFVLWNRALRRQVRRQTEALRNQLAEKERAQAALAEAERTLSQSQKMEAVGRLAGGVAHDFNNVLTIIASYASLLREQLAARGAEGEVADVDEILSASERASRLTRQLLDFSRATPLVTAQLDLGATVQDLVPMLRRLVGENIQVDAASPPAPVVVEANRTQIEQVLMNLAANARDAMPGGGRLAVTVEERHLHEASGFALPAGRYAVLVVADDGVGMGEETLGRVFEPFFTTKETGKGTGLGLATVFAHVSKLGGDVRVASAPGAGTTFTLALPLSRERVACPPAPPQPAAPARDGGEHILLVEDDEALRRGARRALEGGGHCVTEARDGEEALDLAARGGPFSLVVTDVVMPRRSGPQLVGELRKRGPPVMVLYVSGWVRDGETLDLTAPGTAFLAKPYTAAGLASAVAALVARGRPALPAATA